MYTVKWSSYRFKRIYNLYKYNTDTYDVYTDMYKYTY